MSLYRKINMSGKKLNVALFCGGDSSESEVSVKSALNVFQYIDTELFTAFFIYVKGTAWYIVENPVERGVEGITTIGSAVPGAKTAYNEINKTNFTVVEKGVEIKIDKVFMMIHGTPGENGLLQAYFEMMNVPVTTCSSFVSALTFDKYSCKRFLDYAGVKMAKDVFIRKGSEYSLREVVRMLGLPLFVKPTVGGSSFGVSKVKKEEELEGAIQKAFTECDTIIVEQAVKGREVTCGVYKLKGEICKLPIVEIVTEREYFDYEAKYLGESKELCPAPLEPSVVAHIQNLSAKIFDFMGCKGVVRMDYLLQGEDIYFLEINTVPGMTGESLVPKMLKTAGVPVKQFITNLILES